MKYEPVYIYALIDPRDNKVRYIGKTINPDQRRQQHLSNKGTNDGKVGWINGLLLSGLEPEYKILERAHEKNWSKREKWWIKRGREFGWPLLNMSPGGEAGNLYQLPSSFYWLLPKSTLDKLEILPQKRQADIVVEVAGEIADGFIEMVTCYVNEDFDGYYRLQNEGRETVIKEISRILAVKSQ